MANPDDPLSRSPSAAGNSDARTPQAPYTPATPMRDTPATPRLPPSLPCSRPPAASLPPHLRPPPPSPPALPDAPPAAPRSLPARSGTLESSPASPFAPQTRSDHPAATVQHPLSGTSALQALHCMDPAE